MYSLKIQSISSTGNITTPLYNFIKLFKVFIIDSFKGATQPLSDFPPHLPSLPCPSPCSQPEGEAIYLADSSGALRDDYLSSQTPDAIGPGSTLVSSFPRFCLINLCLEYIQFPFLLTLVGYITTKIILTHISKYEFAKKCH